MWRCQTFVCHESRVWKDQVLYVVWLVVDQSGDERRSTSVTLVDADESSELPDQSSKCYGNEESMCLKVHVHTQLGSWSGPKTERRSRAVCKRTGPQRFEFCLRSECCRGVWLVMYPLSFGDTMSMSSLQSSGNPRIALFHGYLETLMPSTTSTLGKAECNIVRFVFTFKGIYIRNSNLFTH